MTLGTATPPKSRARFYEMGVEVICPELRRDLTIIAASAQPVFVYDKATSDKIDALLAEVDELSRELRETRARIDAIERERAEWPTIEIREVNRNDAKREIEAYFDAHSGETLFPSDIALALQLAYEIVVDLVHELEAEGRVGKA